MGWLVFMLLVGWGVAGLFVAVFYIFSGFLFGSESVAFSVLLGIFAYCLCIFLIFFLVFRWVLIIPQTALEEANASLKRSWESTRGNVWRMFGIALCVSFPLSFCAVVIQRLTVIVESIPVLLVASALNAGITVFLGILSVRAVSFIYIHLIQNSVETR